MTRSQFLIVLGVRGGGPAYSLEPSEGKVAAIKDAVKYEGEMSGFTLFEVKDGWQMSIRPADEPGWIIQRIPEPEALAILAALEADKRFLAIDATVGKLIASRNNAAAERRQDLDNPTAATTRRIFKHPLLAAPYGKRPSLEALEADNKAAREALTAAIRDWMGR